VKIVALAGGVGGAKLAWGLAQVLGKDDLTIIVNTGDDFIHLGLNISPDIDTVCYTLANLSNPKTGWGRDNESFNCLEELQKFDAPGWFNLGDKDLALHIVRTELLKNGWQLSKVTNYLCERIGVQHLVVPMSNRPVSTLVHTKELGVLPFQEYFVKYQCKPTMTGVDFKGIELAELPETAVKAVNEAETIIICPSNPWVSISPIIEVPGFRPLLTDKKIVAVSPIIGGKTVKGPAAKMFSEMGIEPSATSVANFYGNLIKGIVIDNVDKEQMQEIERCGIIPIAVNTLMSDNSIRIELAKEVLSFTEKL
jgi:LPPG:FO 2-phospho-L-lactate transferase